MNKILIILSALLFIGCQHNNNSSLTNNETSTIIPTSDVDKTTSNQELSSIESSQQSENYKEKIKIYINPSVQVHNLYYDKITTEAEAMNIVAKNIYNELSLDNRFIVYINDRMLKLSDSVKESNNYNVDYHIALHTNAGGGSGSEAFYYSNNSFATIILNNVMKTHSFPNRGVKKAKNLYELKNSKAKHKTLIEFLFHDNKTESQYIKDNYDKLAKSICNALYQIADN